MFPSLGFRGISAMARRVCTGAAPSASSSGDEMKPVKRVEIVVETLVLQRVTEIVDAAGIKGYTVIRLGSSPSSPPSARFSPASAGCVS